MGDKNNIRILLCADTHLGFDEPVRPRVEKRRRGPDFFANFQRILDSALDGRVDLVVHGGDLFFRSRVPAQLVDRVYKMLIDFAAKGVPILIVPGNHERSMLPSSLYLNHPNIHVFAEPETKLFEFSGTKVTFSGFPCERKEVRKRFASIVNETEWSTIDADVRFLCLHQAVEGAQVGPSNFTFRKANDVIQMIDLPPEFDAVLAGHIHRRQVLFRDRADGSAMPVIYPGSIERTSFAEKDEPKGYFVLTVGAPTTIGRRRLDYQFVQLPARPMEDIVIENGIDRRGLRAFLQSRLADLDPNSIVRFKCADGVPAEVRAALTGRFLREACPTTMNYQFGSGFFEQRRRGNP